MGRIHEDHATSPVNPGVSQHESGSSQSAQRGDGFGMDTTPGGSLGPSSPVAGDHKPVRCIAVSKAPCVLGSSVGTPGSGGIPLALGQPPGICLPAYYHRNERSSQTESLSHLRSHLDRPLLASRRMVSSSAGPSITHSNRPTLTSRSAATPHFHRFQDNLPLLRLTTWRLSSDSPVRHASLRQWLAILPSVGEILD